MTSTTSSLQPESSLWATLNVPLPALKYENTTASGKGKGSTVWAAHSHTPLFVNEWTDFDALVDVEGNNDGNNTTVAINLESELAIAQRYFSPVSEEEHVTANLNLLLQGVYNYIELTHGIVFNTRSNELASAPDLIAMKRNDERLGVGDISEYKSPERGQKAQVRRETVALVRNLYLFPFETKPVWKFGFVDTNQGHTRIISEWEIPPEFDEEKMYAKAALPEEWSAEKKKVFHLVRQIYGQMISDQCKYGIFHVYERWFFCKRTEQGGLFLSRAFGRMETSPSVLQAIKTMVGFEDHDMTVASVHPTSASKLVRATKKARLSRDPSNPSSHSGSIMGSNVAATLFPWDCQVYDATGNILLMTARKYPSLVVKLQQNQ